MPFIIVYREDLVDPHPPQQRMNTISFSSACFNVRWLFAMFYPMHHWYITVRTYLDLKFWKTFGEYLNMGGTYPLGWWSGRMVACFWAASPRRWDCKFWKAR